MNNATRQIVNKAWNFALVLRDDGLLYMAYTEQITFLLFLTMAGPRGVQARRPHSARHSAARPRGSRAVPALPCGLQHRRGEHRAHGQSHVVLPAAGYSAAALIAPRRAQIYRAE